MDFIQYQKLSKKKQKELNTQKRGHWDCSPITRVVPNKKTYNRKVFKKGGNRNED